MNEELKRETERKVALYKELNKDVLPEQILFVGSSLMEQFPINEFIEERGWDIKIYNRGIGGYKTEDLLKVMDVCIYDLKPRRIFINIGTNDLSDPNMTLEAVMDNYNEIICKIKNELPNADIYMMAYYPINYDAAAEWMKDCLKIRTNEKINEANKLVEKLAKKHNARYIDINNGLKDEKGRLKAEFTTEGMHIKKEGYGAILDDIMKYVWE